MRYRIMIMCLALIGAPVASAQPTATAPAQSTPKGALRVLAAASEAGDPELIKGVLLFSTPMETRMAGAMADFASAMVKVRIAAKAEFGAEGAKALIGDPGVSAEDGRRRIDAARETIDGDTARVTEEGGHTIVLTQVDGKWKIPMKEVAAGAPANEVQKNVELMEAEAKLVRQLALEITAKKYKTAEEARQELEQRLKAATSQPAEAEAPATTRP